MTAPERIWADFTLLHDQVTTFYCQDGPYSGGTEYIRADLAAVQPAQVRVKPLDLSNILKHAFMSGWEKSETTSSSAEYMWTEYDPTESAAYARILAALEPLPDPRELTVWYGKMPESNGRENWTAILRPKAGDNLNGILDGFCFARSEYPDRVRYEADRMRWIIGELTEKPHILAYDADLHSGYVERPDPRDEVIARLVEALEGWVNIACHCNINDGSCCCGDDMENHAEPMNCGHVPVDHGSYIADGMLKTTRAALAAAKAVQR